MKYYRKLIKPVITYLDAEDNQAHSNIEETDAWYPEEEQELLHDKYKHLEDGFHTIAFEEKYEEVNIKKEGKIELKPCPFCGGEAEMNVKHGSYGYTPDIYYVKCKRCGQKIELVSEDYKNLSNAAVNTWNSRTNK